MNKKLQNMLLTKEEIPIMYENCFEVPIHPKLLSSDARIDENLARTVFPEAAEEWYKDLKEYSKTLNDKSKQEWINDVFLKKKPKIKKEYDSQMLNTLNWEDKILTLENGFANHLSISRNDGGSLYFHRNDPMGSEVFVSFNGSSQYIRFSKEKALEFSIKKEIIKLGSGIEGVNMNKYNMHNVDFYPGALFLRNWALLYLNEAMKQVLK